MGAPFRPHGRRHRPGADPRAGGRRTDDPVPDRAPARADPQDRTDDGLLVALVSAVRARRRRDSGGAVDGRAGLRVLAAVRAPAATDTGTGSGPGRRV